jgi:hypothetical protein
MQTATAATITRPGHLIEIGFPTPVRYATVGDVEWGGLTWIGNRSIKVGQMSDAGGTLTFGNVDDAFAALVLGVGVAGRRVRLWSIDAAALAAGDPVLIFDGEADEASVEVERVTMRVVAHSAATVYSPRRFIGPSAGFTHLVPAGSTITVGTTKMILERW